MPALESLSVTGSRGAVDLDSATPKRVRGRALIVDDETANRRLLSLMLQREGFHSLEAQSGEEALALFAAERPDIVFMDVVMPGLDGFETTRRIKAMAGLDFIPVIFLTALKDEQSLVRCTQSGGDDFLVKPFSVTVLKARILAMERVRDLQRTISAKQQALTALWERDREEHALAERVLSQAVSSQNAATDKFGLVQRSAAIFSGDLVLSAHLPGGGLRILVGDFTGHGLAATIGALPVADVFHAMTRKGFDDARVLLEINDKLYRVLPTDRFMAACLISISRKGDELRWWNGGMPSCWLRTRTGLRELVSHALPLGVLPDLAGAEAPRRIPVSPGDRLLMMTDGVLEACDGEGLMFVNAGFDDVLKDWLRGAPVLPALFEAFDAHCAETPQFDDVAVVEVPFEAHLFAAPTLDQIPVPLSGWRWSLELEGERVARQPSIESVLEPLGLLDGLRQHMGVIETIVSELYSNALEHGVLKLDSSMKETPEGFDAYYRERARRLVHACSGQVTLRLSYRPEGDGGCVRVQVSDSGDGFKPDDTLGVARNPTRPWGRGIALVRDLCESVTYRGNGSEVDAIYRW